MGKFERDWAEQIEEEIAHKIAGTINSRDYSSKGDIEKDGVFFEVKSSKKTFSFGTLGNLGQDFLTEVEVFKCISWSKFREESGFEKYRWDIFFSLSKVKNKSSFYQIAHKVKEEYSNEINEVVEKSKEDRENYLKLLTAINKEKLKIFTFNMFSGRTSLKKYKRDLAEIEKDFKVFLECNGEVQETSYLERIGNLDFEKLEVRSSGTSLFISSLGRDILRICFHWKNKFQGCQTPCLNIFSLL